MNDHASSGHGQNTQTKPGEPAFVSEMDNRLRREAMVEAAGMTSSPPASDHPSDLRSEASLRFTRTAAKRFGLRGLRNDEEGVARMDQLIVEEGEDARRFLRTMPEDMASWLGETMRHAHGFAWDEAVVSDGRVVFDPRAAVESALDGGDMAMSTEIAQVLNLSSIRSLA